MVTIVYFNYLNYMIISMSGKLIMLQHVIECMIIFRNESLKLLQVLKRSAFDS